MDLYNTSVTASDVGTTARAVTSNITHDFHVPKIWSMGHLIVTSVILGVLIVGTVIGNVLVITAVILEKKLHSSANYLILSLAVSDLMVAVTVMPIRAVWEVTQYWFMGSEICAMWVAMCVLCCTASIYGLVAIAINRYRAVTKVDYLRKRTNKRMGIITTIIWIASLSIAFPVIPSVNTLDETGLCFVILNPFYLIFATVLTFYLPSAILIITYAKIFAFARKKVLRKKISGNCTELCVQQCKYLTSPIKDSPTFKEPSDKHLDTTESDISETANIDTDTNDFSCPTKEQVLVMQLRGSDNTRNEVMKAKLERDELIKKRERKLARTLAFITGCFLVCWLPFFVFHISTPLLSATLKIKRLVVSITLWLGLVNSLLNPIMYTMFNKKFRKAFKNILCSRCFKN